jgi:hypothetical protein
MARQLESYAHLDGMRIRSTHHDPHSTTCCADRLLKLADDAHAVKILRPFVRHVILLSTKDGASLPPPGAGMLYIDQ